MKMPEASSGDADKPSRSAAGKKLAAAGKNPKTRMTKSRRYHPLDNRRDWYEKAEGQLAITAKAPSKPRAGS